MGEAWNVAPESDANQIPGTGWFAAYKNTPTDGWWLIQDINEDVVHYQFAFAITNASGVQGGIILQRDIQKGEDWGAWEYINPPMNLGVEYRTTERYLGKPVYTKVIDFGASPNNGAKNVNLGASNVDKICGASFHYYVPSTGENGVMVSHLNYTGFLVSNTVVQIRTNTDKTDTNFYVTVKYTKTTD